MLGHLDNFFFNQKEPNKGCFLALRYSLLNFSDAITEHWKYKLPFYYLNGKPFCYLWQDRKTTHPYIGVVKGNLIHSPYLIQGNRKKMKIFVLDPEKDLPVQDIYAVLNEAMKHYH